MNKLYIASALMLAGVVSVSAEQPVQVRGMMYASATASPVMMRGEGKMMPATRLTEAKPVEGMNHGQVVSLAARAIPAQMMVPQTGDPAIDAQLKVLTEEMNAKMKAINDEYQVKIKALVGTRPLKFGGMMGSTTQGMPMHIMGKAEIASSTRGVMMKRVNENMQNNTMGNNGAMMEAVTVTSDGNGMMQGGERPMRPAPENNGNENKGMGAQFNTMFRNMFSGDR